MSRRKVAIVPPEKFSDLTIYKPKTEAVGMPAITSSIKHIADEMGMAKGFKLLSKMNQQHGFDCPGCAWPDPEKPSVLGEYCENGAKAIAEEATAASRATGADAERRTADAERRTAAAAAATRTARASTIQ